MQDMRIERWAHTLVHHCLYVKAGETDAILATPLATPLVEAVYREVVRVGAKVTLRCQQHKSSGSHREELEVVGELVNGVGIENNGLHGEQE